MLGKELALSDGESSLRLPNLASCDPAHEVPKLTMNVHAGPLGNGMKLEAGMQDPPIWSYVKSRTQHGGVSLEGRVVLERNEENECIRFASPFLSAALSLTLTCRLQSQLPHQGVGVAHPARRGAQARLGRPALPDCLRRRGCVLCSLPTSTTTTRASLTLLTLAGLDFEPYSIPQGPSPSECHCEPPRSADASPAEANPDSSAPPLPPRTTLSTTTPSPTRISPAPSFLSYFSRSASAASSHSSQSTATSPVSPGQQRRLPKEDLDDDDLAARREMEEAMRSFGIEDPDVNARSRAEDPLLIVEPRSAGVNDELEGDPEAADETATTGRTGTATPDLTTSPGSGLLSDEVEHPPDSPGAQRPRTDGDGGDVEQTPTVAQGETMARQGSRRSVGGDKPPVPPRRTPRLGTTSAVTSPSMVQGEAVVEEKERDVEAKSGDEPAAVVVEQEHEQGAAEGSARATSDDAAEQEHAAAEVEQGEAAAVELADAPAGAGPGDAAQGEPTPPQVEAHADVEQEATSHGESEQDGRDEVDAGVGEETGDEAHGPGHEQ